MDKNGNSSDAIRAMRQSIPGGEMSVYRCPKCKETIETPTIAVADWGIPNIHTACGWRGGKKEMKFVKAYTP